MQLYPVSIQSDELFSSWLVRVSLTHGCDPLTLTGSLWPKWRIWTIDRDRGIDKNRLNVLVNATAFKVEDFKSMFMQTIIQSMNTQPLNHKSHWTWLIPYGHRNRINRGGLQYCPTCLETDSEPYFRRFWRLSWKTVCLEHNIRLLDHCTACHKPIQFNHITAFDPSLGICGFCKKSLITKSKPASISEIDFNKNCEQQINLPNSDEYFSLIRFYITILRYATHPTRSKLRFILNEYGISNTDITCLKTASLNFDQLPVTERIKYIVIVHNLLQESTNKFIKHCLKHELTYNNLIYMYHDLPMNIASGASQLPKVKHNRNKRSTAIYKGPRTKKDILNIHTRIVRKVLAKYEKPN